MAISECHYRILKSLREDGTLPECKSILNIGQPNWYGDMPIETAWEEITGIPCKSAEVVKHLVELLYGTLLGGGYVQFASIDMGGDERAIKADLNKPLAHGNMSKWVDGDWDLIVNHGTAEHIFNVAQVFCTMHDHCKPGGFMIHESPWTGWIDHGFYSLHPTLFYDLAAANGYELPYIAIEVIDKKRILRIESREAVANIVGCGGPPENAMLFVVFQKTADAEFRIPQQGVYAGNVSQEVTTAWRQLR